MKNKTRKTKENSALNVLYMVALLLVLLALSLVLPGGQHVVQSSTQPATDAQVLSELSQLDEIKPYSSSSVQVTFLSTDAIGTLRTQQPSLYVDVPANTFMVTYSGDPGLLVIYDFNNKEILKMFAVANFDA